MASEFTARIRAELDLSGVESKLKALGKEQKVSLALDTKSLDSQIASIKSKLKSLNGINIDFGGKSGSSNASRSGSKAGQDFASAMIKRINAQISNGGIEASIAKVTAQYEKLGSTGHSKLGSIKSDIEQLNKLQSLMGNSSSADELVKNYTEFNQTLQRVKNNLSTVSAEAKTFANALQIKTLDNKIESWMEKNTKAARAYGETLNRLRSQLSGKSSMNFSDFSSIENQFKSIQAAAVATGKIGNSFATTFTRAFSSISNYVSVSAVIYGAVNAARQMYQSVLDIDTAMTELRKVSDAGSIQLATVFENSKASAREYATVLSDIISATADWSRLGYDVNQAQELAKVAALYKNVGDNIDITTANESLISTFKGFNMGVEDAVGIVDRFNEVSNNFAISSDGIGAALQRSASSMSAANNTLDESIALITGANTVVQDPDSVGKVCADIKDSYIG